MSTAGLIYGPDLHYLDHLAPLCSLFEVPLILTEDRLIKEARTFYPNLTILQNLSPDEIVQQFDRLIVSTPRPLFDEVFYFSQMLQNKRVQTIWCPHGNSDKGRQSPHMEALKEEEILLTYGPRIEMFLREKGVTAPCYRVGNYRLHYYETHKAFYQTHFPKKSGAILYAPTWQDNEQNSSFPALFPYLLNAPENVHVKLHPNLYLQYPEEIKQLKIPIIEHTPIYPILAQYDLLITDLSSIGYDYLAFKRPLILLKESDLVQAGYYVPESKYKHLFTICEEVLQKKKQKESSLYAEAFSTSIASTVTLSPPRSIL